MDDSGASEAEDDESGRVGDEGASDVSTFPDTPTYEGEHLDQWYGAYTAAGLGSASSVTGEVLDAWFGTAAAMDLEEQKPSWDEALDDYPAADGEAPPWEATEPSSYA
jgi:hypothetical protein